MPSISISSSPPAPQAPPAPVLQARRRFVERYKPVDTFCQENPDADECRVYEGYKPVDMFCQENPDADECRVYDG